MFTTYTYIRQQSGQLIIVFEMRSQIEDEGAEQHGQGSYKRHS